MTVQGPGVVFAPASLRLLKRGVDTMVNVVRPTLGPTIRHVALAKDPANKSPELLDDAATISRRIIEIPNPYANTGAMLARHVMWDVHEAVGDGAATAAVIMQALVSEAVRLAAAGWNVMMMRQGIERALGHALTSLRAMARPINSEADVVGLTLAASGDPDLAKRMGEIYDTLGADCHIEVQDAYTPGIRHEFIEGAYWRSGWVSSSFANNELGTETKLTDARVLVVDGHVNDWQQLAPVLNELAGQPNPALLVVAYDVTNTALALLLSNKDKVPCVAVKAPSYGDHMRNMLQDLAIQTGARLILTSMNEDMLKVTLADLGKARSVTANRDYFGLTGGAGEPRAIRERIASLREQIRNPGKRSKEEIDQLRERLGKLAGGIAVIYVCGSTPAETEARKGAVELTVNTVRQALAGGVVPGGGAAYVHCAQTLRELSLPPDQAVGVEALMRALEEPLRVIAHNSGASASTIAAQARTQQPGWGYNALTGQFEDLWKSGLVDPLPVVETALAKAASGAMMTLTTGVIVHHRKPTLSTEP